MATTDTVRVEVNGDFTADDLDEVIRSLAKARAGLAPAVPLKAPDGTIESELLVQDDALFKIATLADGGLRIWLRSEGFGWMAFNLSAAQAAGLREFLGKGLGHTHTSH